MSQCTKCKLEDEEVSATHHCSQCNHSFCDLHVQLHNNSNKTKDHASSVQSLANPNALVPFSGKFELVELLGDREETNFAFNKPTSITIDSKNERIFIADSNSDSHLIIVFNLKTKQVIKQFECAGSTDGYIYGLKYDVNDDTLVYTCNSELIKIRADGMGVSFKVDIPKYGFRYLDLDKKNSDIYIGTRDGTRSVMIFSKDGKYLKEIGLNNHGDSILNDSEALCFDVDGNIIIADGASSEGSYAILNNKGKLLKRLPRPLSQWVQSIIVDPANSNILSFEGANIVMCNAEGKECKQFGGSKAMKEKVGESEFPICYADLALDSKNGELYLACRDIRGGDESTLNAVMIFK